MRADAVIVDIDGTLALRGDRSPYEWSRVLEDMPNAPVVRLVTELSRQSQIIYVSGRSDVCRAETELWLIRNCVKGKLHMRRSGDHRMDALIKEEFFRSTISGQWNVWMVLDDRDQTVKMWRQLGLTCMQVALVSF